MLIETHPSRCPRCKPNDKDPIIARGNDFEYKTCSNEFSFRFCRPCKILYLDPQPEGSAIPTLYPESYEPYCFHQLPRLIGIARSLVQRKKVTAISDLVGSRAKILDIGCGNGTLLKLLVRFGSPDWEIYGQESNLRTVERLRVEGLRVHSCNLEKLALKGHFDLVILNQVIEHVGDVPALLKQIGYLLKPDGILFVETPSFEGLDARLFRARYWGGYHFPRHWYLFNQDSLACMLGQSGYRVIKTNYLASPAFWIQSFHHLLADKGWDFLSRLFRIQNPILLAAFTSFDLAAIFTGRKTSNFRMVAQRRDEC